MKLFQLCTDQIELHKPLPWNVRNEPGNLLLSKGYLLADRAQLEALISRGVYVDQDEFEAHAKQEAEEEAKKDPFTLWTNINQRVGDLLGQHANNPLFKQGIDGVSGDIQFAMAKDVEAGMFEAVCGEQSSYAVSHCVQTAFVANLAAERFGWSEADRHTLTSAALTMNIAMLEMQNTLAQQLTPPSPQQRALISSHASQGRTLLEQSGVDDDNWLRTVEQHHVTTDGRGLPQDRDDISQMACMVHYADVYLAKISARASRPALAVNVAARELYLNAGGANNPYAAAIIKEMGIYPPGSFVKLANGDTALVVRRGEAAHTPQVHSIMNARGMVLSETVPRDTAQSDFKVMTALPRGSVMVKLNRSKLFGYAAA